MCFSLTRHQAKWVKQLNSSAFLTLTERPWPQPLKHWKKEGRRFHRISQEFRSILVMTCQPEFPHKPPPVKKTWPLFFKSRCICGRPAERMWLKFLYSTGRYCVFPWSGDNSDLGRGGDCLFSGNTMLANSGGWSHARWRLQKAAAAFVSVLKLKHAWKMRKVRWKKEVNIE